MIYLVANIHNKPTERHVKARTSWEALVIEEDLVVIAVDQPPPKRTALAIGDPRNLPFLNDLLTIGMKVAEDPNDIIIWTNDDVQLDRQICPWARSMVRLHGAVSMRRSEIGDTSGEIHMGRELFAFTRQWLEENLDSIPSFYVGCPFFDIVLAAIIRKQHGITSTIENIKEDLYPSDSEHRYALHEPHPSSWAGENEFKFPANLHNRKMAKEWCANNMPTLKL